MRCRIAFGSEPGGSTTVLRTFSPLLMRKPSSTCWAWLPSHVSATAYSTPVAWSITGVPTMPTVGVMSPHGSELDGTGVPALACQTIWPVEASSA